MIWQEFLVDRSLDKDKVCSTLASIFQVEAQEALVVDDIYDAKIEKGIKVVCECIAVEGDFSGKFSVYIYDSNLIPADDKIKISEFSEMLQCKCLMTSASENPYQGFLIQGSHTCEVVFLDPVQFDEYERYIIAYS